MAIFHYFILFYVWVTFCRGASLVAQWDRIHLRTEILQEMGVQSVVLEDPLEKEIATQEYWALAWEAPCPEEAGGLQSTESQRGWCNLATKQQQHNIPLYIYTTSSFSIHLSVTFRTSNLGDFHVQPGDTLNQEAEWALSTAILAFRTGSG